jgi:hypothetical protein
MACYIHVNGVLVDVQRGSISIEKRIEERSTASFVIVDEAGIGNYVRGMPVEIFKPWALPPFYIPLFTGYIDTPGRKRLAPNYGLLHDISCMDNHYLADKRLVVKSYTNKTLGFIVNDIWTDYLSPEGVAVGEIQTGPTISSAIFNYVRVSEAFDALKELSGFTWRIDDNKDLYFVDRLTYLAPWNLDSTTHRALSGSVRLSTGNPFYRNRQYVRGGTGLTAVQTVHFTGDGVITSFPLGYPLALVPTITEDAAPMAVGIKGIDSGADYYWSKGDNTIYADVAPGIGVAVEVTYYGQYPLIALASDAGAQLARQAIEGGTGIVEDIETEVQHESSASIQESVKGKLTQYCQDAERFIYDTTEDELLPGQLQQITYTPFGFSAHEMLIESVNIRPHGELIVYSVSAITGPAIGSWARFFSNILTRADKRIQIGDSLLLVLFQQSEVLALTEAPAQYSDDFSGGIVNRWLALPPAQSEGYNVEHEIIHLTEAAVVESQVTEDYFWDDVATRWDFFTWG